MSVGLQILVVPWLAVDYLNLSPSVVGFVQAATLLPNLIFLVLGGIRADRGALLTSLSRLVVIYVLVHAVLLCLFAQDWLSRFTLLGYAVLLGSVNAFIQPSKDYLVGFLAGNQLQNAIAQHTLSQNFGQATGFILASFLYRWDLMSIPLVQITILCVVFGLLKYMATIVEFGSDSSETKPPAPSPYSWLSGFHKCWQSNILRSLIVIVSINGFFHIGVFVVALPLLARDIYFGDASFYGLLQCFFVLGSAVATILVIIRGDLDSPGRRVIFGLLYSGLILLGLSVEPTQYGTIFLIFLWGVVVGVNAILGRTILQSRTLADYRGRVISVYQLALFGFAPLGSLVAGVAIEHWGVLFVLKLSAIASFTAFAAMFLTRALWDLQAEDVETAE
ncbi:MAG: hypothetical protein ACI82Z_000803 [Cellvibrionaceae bacterium]|jgi:hypothetical protein